GFAGDGGTSVSGGTSPPTGGCPSRSFQELIDALKAVPAFAKLDDQRLEVVVELIGPRRGGADVDQQEKAVQAVRVLLLAGQDAVVDDIARHVPIPHVRRRVVSVGARPAGKVD